MTNLEKYIKDEKFIEDIVLRNLAMEDGEPINCDDCNCNDCDWYNDNCEEKARQWIYKDYDIRVGDVVKFKEFDTESKLIVTRISDDGEKFSGIRLSGGIFGNTYSSRNLNSVKKTGEHFNLAEIFNLTE